MSSNKLVLQEKVEEILQKEDDAGDEGNLPSLMVKPDAILKKEQEEEEDGQNTEKGDSPSSIPEDEEEETNNKVEWSDEEDDEEDVYDHEEILRHLGLDDLDNQDEDDDEYYDDYHYDEEAISGSADLDQFMLEQGMRPWDLDDVEIAGQFLADQDDY